MPKEIKSNTKPVEQELDTLGVGEQSTQPSSIEKRAASNSPVEFGRYRLLEQLGEGGMGVVYLAHDIELDRKVALKLPHFSGAKSKDLAERFRREARLAATLDHPNICRVYDIGEYQSQLYLTMAFVEGRSLSDILKSKGPIDPRTAVTLLQRIAKVVHFAHQQGVIHRDLKPANIMIKKDRDFVVMDFGLARRVDQEEPQLTATGAVLGTPAYMAPEQLRGEKGASGPQSDVYSLGIILFELLTGRRPFQGTLPQIYAQILTNESVSPSLVRNNVDSALDKICLKATNKEVSKRYQSAEELASALEQYLVVPNSTGPALGAGSKQQTKLEFPAERRATRPPRRRRPTVLTALGGTAFLALLFGVIVILVRNNDGTTTEYTLAEGAVSVEVQKDDRTLLTVDVSDARQPATKEPGMRSADDSPAEAELRNRTTTPALLEVEGDSRYQKQLRIVVEQVDACELGISDRGIEFIGRKWANPKITINGVEWNPENQSVFPLHKTNEYNDFRPDYARAQIQCLKAGGAISYRYGPQSLRLQLTNVPNAVSDYEFLVQLPHQQGSTAAVETSPDWTSLWKVECWAYAAQNWYDIPEGRPVDSSQFVGSVEAEYVDWLTYDAMLHTAPFLKLPVGHFVMAGERRFQADGGRYRLETVSDDGIRVYLDGNPVLDSWKVQGVVQNSSTFVVPPGQHSLSFEYFQQVGLGTLGIVLRCIEPQGTELERTGILRNEEEQRIHAVKLATIKELRSLGAYVREELNSPRLLVSEVDLRYADIRENGTIENETLKLVSSLPDVRMLRIGRNEVDSAGWIHLNQLKDLAVLDAHNGTIDIEDLREIAKLGCFKFVAIGGGTGADDSWIEILANMPNLEVLHLWYSKNVTDASIETFSTFPKLREVFANGTGITPEGVERLKLTKPSIVIHQ